VEELLERQSSEESPIISASAECSLLFLGCLFAFLEVGTCNNPHYTSCTKTSGSDPKRERERERERGGEGEREI
jgi:hypothetical protein